MTQTTPTTPDKSAPEKGMEEIWKDVFGYEGLYQVSNLGRIKSKTRFVKFQTYRGYNSIALHKNNRRKKMRVHRVVLEAFVGKNDGLEANHINGIRNDNRLENLEWVTRRENGCHRSLMKGNLVGVKKSGLKYCAQIKIDNKYLHIGTYETEQEAAIAYQNTCSDFGISNRYAGQF